MPKTRPSRLEPDYEHPRNMGRIWSTYDFQQGTLNGVSIGGGILAIGKRAGDLQDDFYLPGFMRVDVALYYRKREVLPRTNLQHN